MKKVEREKNDRLSGKVGGGLTWGHLFVNSFVKLRTAEEQHRESDVARSDPEDLKAEQVACLCI